MKEGSQKEKARKDRGKKEERTQEKKRKSIEMSGRKEDVRNDTCIKERLYFRHKKGERKENKGRTQKRKDGSTTFRL